MKTNEIKKTQEIVVRTEYVADDGVVFYSKEECEKYEESALFMASLQLKRIMKGDKDFTQYDINDECSDEYIVEIFNIENANDLENLGKYLRLKMLHNKATENSIEQCFKSRDKRIGFSFDGITVGHEVMIFWTYDEDWFWVYGDGSINGYVEFFRNKLTNLIYPKKEN